MCGSGWTKNKQAVCGSLEIDDMLHSTFFVFSYNIILMIVPRVCHFRGDSTGSWTNHQGTLLLH